MAARAAHSIATLTVMRGEVDLLRDLMVNLQWADERHIVETSPNGHKTEELAGDTVFHHSPLPLGTPFDQARAVAQEAIGSDWILVVDVDERIPDALVRLLRSRLEEWDRRGVDGVWIARQNVILGVPLRYSSAWPDYQLHFVRRRAARFDARLHRPVIVEGKTERLPANVDTAIRHYPIRSTTQAMDKFNVYSTIEADQGSENAPLPPGRAFLRATREFAARYVKMRGYKDGRMGLHYAILMSIYRYLSITKHWERSRRP